MATPTITTPTSIPTLPTSPIESDQSFSADLSPSTPRHTILNLPDADDFYSEAGSAPGTPMSCVSTVAIKDGHEGHRPGMTGFDGAAERISRLSSLTAGGYFDVDKRPDTPASVGFGPGTSDEPKSATLSAALEDARRKKKLQDAQGDSPASSVTTESAREQRKEARLIDGMTYDEDVVDTTDRSPMVAGTPREEESSK